MVGRYRLAGGSGSLVFLTANSSSVEERFNHVPAAYRHELESLLAQYSESVFKECEFPPFPPQQDVDFKIQLEPGAQVTPSPVGCLPR